MTVILEPGWRSKSGSSWGGHGRHKDAPLRLLLRGYGCPLGTVLESWVFPVKPCLL